MLGASLTTPACMSEKNLQNIVRLAIAFIMLSVCIKLRVGKIMIVTEQCTVISHKDNGVIKFSRHLLNEST